jgi:hypothetical protein
MSWINSEKGVITGIIGGIPFANGNIIEIVLLGKWLFLYAFYFFIICRKLGKSKSNIVFTLYRYKYFKTWWRHHFVSIHTTSFFVFIASCAIWRFFDIFYRKSDDEFIAVMLAFFLHLSVWISILALCDVVSERKIAPCILLIVEGMLYIFSVNYNLTFLECGMYVRCHYYRMGYGVVAAYGVEILMIAICYFSVPRLWKYGFLERKVV